MKTKLFLIVAALLATLPAAFSQITTGSDGSDGALTFTPNSGNQTIDLTMAGNGAWNAPSPVMGKGIYDRDKGAVVFKYTSVNIPTGVTVSFTNHASRAPVVWLVTGNVTVTGTLSLNGSVSANGSNLASNPGPGGFRGGAAGSLGKGTGLGIGGSNDGANATYASSYGNPSIIPLIGGSGGAGNQNIYPGGGGGGAIVIAAQNIIMNGGLIRSNPGDTNNDGSSGAIRLVADSISGSGNLDAHFDGRIRLETVSISGNIVTQPQTVAVSPRVNPPNNSVVIWPSDTAPTVRIVSVDPSGTAIPTNNVPLYPAASLEGSADVGISVNTSMVVTVETRNFDPAALNRSVKVRAAGKFSPTATLTDATFQSGNTTMATWTATIPYPGSSFTTLQAIATVP